MPPAEQEGRPKVFGCSEFVFTNRRHLGEGHGWVVLDIACPSKVRALLSF